MNASLSVLLDKSTDFFCVLDRNGTIKHTNPALRNALGYNQSELEGTKANTLSHPADIKRRDDLFKSITPDSGAVIQESRIKAKNGTYLSIEWHVVLDATDGLIYATGINLTLSLLNARHSVSANNLQQIIQSFKEGFLILNSSYQITSFNPAFQAITGLSAAQLQNGNFKQLSSLGITAEVMTALDTTLDTKIAGQVQFFNIEYNRWLRANFYPHENEVIVFLRDITDIKIQQLILALEKKVLEINASALYTLGQTINELLTGIEEIYPDMICSVLEVDEAQQKVYHLAGPRLPKVYCDAVNGQPIGPKAGSCGAAVYHRSQVIVSDIETDPLWANYKDLILPYGIKACWSTPIISSHSSQVLATFAVYYTLSRKPKTEELQMIERTANILRVLIENKRSQEHVQNQNKMLQEIAAISSHDIRRPVATILGLISLFDRRNLDNPLNREIIMHLDISAQELDTVIHTIVEKTIYLKSEQ